MTEAPSPRRQRRFKAGRHPTPSYYKDIYDDLDDVDIDSNDSSDHQGDNDKKKPRQPPQSRCRRFVRVVSWLVVVNAWTVILFTKRHFSSMSSLALAKLEGDNNNKKGSFNGESTTAANLVQVMMTNMRRDILQYRGQWALEEMEDYHVFHTPVTTQASVLERGFPHSWEPCTMQNALERSAVDEIPLKIVVLGGRLISATGEDEDCDYELEDMSDDSHSLEERHDVLTALLQKHLQRFLNHDLRNNSGIKFDVDVVNMGQHASMTPTVQTLLLDQVLNPLDTDLIIWQPPLMISKSITEQKQEMELFLTRVTAFFHQAGHRTPPILALQLDDLMVESTHKKGMLIQHLWQSILKEAYTSAAASNEEEKPDGSMDWNVQVINAGAAVVSSSVDQNEALVDANYHTTCHGMLLMSNMIQYAIYKNLANCPSKHSGIHGNNPHNNHENEVVEQPAGSNTIDFDGEIVSRNTTLPLMELLYHQDIAVRSHSHWLPNLHGESSRSPVSLYGIQISNITETVKYLEQVPIAPTIGATMAPALMAHQTADNRISYRLPLCSNHQYANFTLAEPQLEWLGLVYKGGRVQCSINDQHLHLDHSGYDISGLRGVRDWIHVARWVEPSPSYNVSLCSRKVNKKGLSSVWLHQMVGLMLPSP